MSHLHHIETERAVLGALLLDENPADSAEVFASLEPESFRSSVHAVVFEAAREVHREGRHLDELVLGEKLVSMGKLEQVGGYAQLAQLADTTPSAANLLEHARVVRDAALRRRYSAVLDAARRVLADEAVPIADAAQGLVREVVALGEATTRGHIKPAREVLKRVFKKLEAESRERVMRKGLSTGYVDLDGLLGGGLQRKELCILAGRPSSGKTALGLDIGVTASALTPTLIESLEMDDEALVLRWLSSRSSVDLARLRAGGLLGGNDWPRIAHALGQLSDKLYIVDQGGLTVEDVRSHARTAKARFGLGLVVVDYLQLMRALPNGDKRTREREVAEMSLGLKEMAKELDVPVLALAQLNRALAGRANKRPELSDLRDSGAVEQDADVVIFVHRESQFNQKAPKDEAEIIVAKNRQGATGTIKLGWEGRFTRFRDPNGGQRGLSV